MSKGNWKVEISIADYDLLHTSIDSVENSIDELNEILKSLLSDDLDGLERDRLGKRMRFLCATIKSQGELVRGRAKEMVGESWDVEGYRKRRP